jgi:hypothetical protein
VFVWCMVLEMAEELLELVVQRRCLFCDFDPRWKMEWKIKWKALLR